jgi:hypothetical protein
MTPFQKLDQLTVLAKADESLRQRLLATAESNDAIWDFCLIAQEAGVELYAGELFALGEEYCDNQCKSTNGGNPSPYYTFNDAYENFIESLK